LFSRNTFKPLYQCPQILSSVIARSKSPSQSSSAKTPISSSTATAATASTSTCATASASTCATASASTSAEALAALAKRNNDLSSYPDPVAAALRNWADVRRKRFEPANNLDPLSQANDNWGKTTKSSGIIF